MTSRSEISVTREADDGSRFAFRVSVTGSGTTSNLFSDREDELVAALDRRQRLVAQESLLNTLDGRR